ncbi:MAG TPA: GDSL-type esterase/lipase family protein, partial [Gemmatimonadaceae bacterium]
GVQRPPGAGNRVVFLGDSIEIRGGTDTQWEQNAWVSHFLIRSNAQVHMLHNAGVAGNTSAQMLARFSTDVAAYKPDKVFVKAGTNDVGNAVPFATSIANIQAIVQAIRDIPAVPILCTIPPRSDGYHQAIETLNAGIRLYARTQGITLVDFHAVLVDPANGNYLAAYNGDNVHPTAIGARVMADTAISATAGLWQKWSPYQPSDNTDPNNWIVNGLMLVDANANGIADSWTQFGSSNATMTIVTDSSIIGKWQQIAKADVGNNIVFDQSFALASGKWSIGDRIAFTGRVKTSGVDAGGGQYKIYLDYGNGNVIYPVGSLWTVDTNGTFYIESVIPAATAAVTAYVIVQGNTITLDFAQFAIINLTTLGLAGL